MKACPGVGIDTPEVWDCGYEQATANMVRLVEGERVRLVVQRLLIELRLDLGPSGIGR